MKAEGFAGCFLILCFTSSATKALVIDLVMDTSTWAKLTDTIGDLLSIDEGLQVKPVINTDNVTFNSDVCNLMNSDSHGLVYFSNDCTETILCHCKSYSNKIPVVIVTNCSIPIYNDSSAVILAYPHKCFVFSMVGDVLSKARMNIDDIIFIIDDDVDTECINREAMKISRTSMRMRILHIFEYKTETFWYTVKKCSSCLFIAMTSSYQVDEIFFKAKASNVLHGDRYWMIVTPTPLNFTFNTSDDTHSKIVVINPVEQVPLLYLRKSIGYLKSLYINTSEEKDHNLSEKINLVSNGTNINYKYIIRRVTKGNEDMIRIGSWSQRHGLQLSTESLFLNSFVDFANKTLKIAAQEAKPFNVRQFLENGTVQWSGFCFDILNELAKGFHFNYVIEEPPDGKWGTQNDDGTWNGMVGMVQRGEVDFAVGPFTITSVRESVIDFTKPYMEDGAGILTLKPDNNANTMFQMFKPFSVNVWISIAVAIIIVGFLLFITNKYSPFTRYNMKEKNSTKDEIRLPSSMWLIFAFFMEQGGEPLPSAISGRCILGFWWIFTILVMSTYTANLAAFLTVTIDEQPINSIDELVSQSNIPPLIKEGTNLYTLFKSSKSGIYHKIWNLLSGSPDIVDSESALDLVRNKNYAFMTDYSQLEFIMLKECKTFALAEELFNTAGYGFVLPENAPYMDVFNEKIMRMQEAGLIEKWHQKWWTSNQDACLSSGRTSSAQTLGLKSLSGLFFVYLAVVVISCIALVVELLIVKNNYKKRKLKMNSDNIKKNDPQRSNELQLKIYSTFKT